MILYWLSVFAGVLLLPAGLLVLVVGLPLINRLHNWHKFGLWCIGLACCSIGMGALLILFHQAGAAYLVNVGRIMLAIGVYVTLWRGWRRLRGVS